jgi:hypothetical protein
MTVQARNIFINTEFLFDYIIENHGDSERFSINNDGNIRIVNIEYIRDREIRREIVLETHLLNKDNVVSNEELSFLENAN